jgi:hypothetical protein
MRALLTIGLTLAVLPAAGRASDTTEPTLARQQPGDTPEPADGVDGLRRAVQRLRVGMTQRQVLRILKNYSEFAANACRGGGRGTRHQFVTSAYEGCCVSLVYVFAGNDFRLEKASVTVRGGVVAQVGR